MKVKFTVELELPETATVEDAREYIADAVTTWKGQLYPGAAAAFEAGSNDFSGDPPDPMFDLDGETVKVTVQRKKRRKR